MSSNETDKTGETGRTGETSGVDLSQYGTPLAGRLAVIAGRRYGKSEITRLIIQEAQRAGLIIGGVNE